MQTLCPLHVNIVVNIIQVVLSWVLGREPFDPLREMSQIAFSSVR